MICSIGGLLQKTGVAGQGPLWIGPNWGSHDALWRTALPQGRNMKNAAHCHCPWRKIVQYLIER